MKLPGSQCRSVSVVKARLEQNFWSELVLVSDTKTATCATWEKKNLSSRAQEMACSKNRHLFFKTCVIRCQYLETRE